MRARVLHLEHAALHAHLATTVARGAHLDPAVGRPRPLARLARRQGGNVDALVDASHRIFKVQLHHVADIGPTPWRLAAATATAEDVAEDVAENIANVLKARTGVAPAHAVLEGGMPLLVIHAALAAVGQDFVGLLGFLERCLGTLVAGVAVRVVLHRRAAVSLLQVIVAGIARHAQYFVIVAFAHRSRLQLS